jgi:RES domain-containing protein
MIERPPSTVYRVTRAQYARTVDDALSGIGGVHDNGRWHSKGEKIVYTSESSTLCLIERVAHADEWLAERRTDRVMLAIKLPDVSFLQFTQEDLAAQDRNWRTTGSLFCRHLGDQWLRRGSSCALIVPSAVNPGDSNILLNPSHPDYQAILDINKGLIGSAIEPDERISSMIRGQRAAAI